MKFRSIAQHVGVVFLCMCLSVPLIPSASADGRDRVVIQVGAPSVWSMGQAHYLLMKMHQKNNDLTTKQPKEDELDPNGVNATRIQILKTLLSIQAEFDQKLGVENRAKIREYESKLQDREIAQQQLREVESELRRIDQELPASKLRLASLKLERDQKRALLNSRVPPTRNDSTPLPTAEEVQALDNQIALLEEEIKLKTERRTTLVAEQARLTPKATQDLTLSGLATPSVGTASGTTSGSGTGGSSSTANSGGSLPEFDSKLTNYIDRSFTEVGRPKLAATTALDNYIGMQYEIISKQLTLLRDEVGPDNRIVFLELPASIYTADKRGDDYLAQVKWEVTHYAEASQREIEDQKSNGSDKEKEMACKTQEDQLATPNAIDFVKQSKYSLTVQGALDQKMLDGLNESDKKKKLEEVYQCDPCFEALTRPFLPKEKSKTIPEKIKSDVIKRIQEEEKKGGFDKRAFFRENLVCWQKADSDLVRAIDIIPRQSSLNINEVQATASQRNFLGLFKFLTGLGVSVNYQRQKQLYEQFLQQEVFAAGFGKGMNSFGWTFGPLPGSHRIAPGVRTMYAVMVVPQHTKQLKIKATGIAYHRKDLPKYEDSQLVFNAQKLSVDDTTSDTACKENCNAYNVLVPGEVTTRWYADEVDYTPAKAGEPVTVILRGNAFSNQTSVLVDGVPLRRVISIGNSASSKAENDAQAGSGVQGQFEVVNSRQIAIKFTMGASTYFGTPTITVVAPEKTESINFFKLKVNGRYGESLYDRSLSEPMFVEPFSLDEKKFKPTDVSVGGGQTFVLAKIQGRGLRRDAAVWVGNDRLDYRKECETSNGLARCLIDFCNSSFAAQTDTNEYTLYFRKPAGEQWPIRYRQQTVRGFEDKEFVHDTSSPPKVRRVQVISYSANPARRVAYLSLRFTKDRPVEAELSTACRPHPEQSLPNCRGRKVYAFFDEGMGNWRANFEIGMEDQGGGKIVEREKVFVTVKTEEKFKENGVEKTELKTWTNDLEFDVTPRIKTIEILRPAITSDTGTEIRIEGINMQNVKKVIVAGQEADILGAGGKDAITVKLKGGAFIKEEKGVKVPVVLVTKEGTSVSGIVTLGGSSASSGDTQKKSPKPKKK